jgi:hypothetical protein
MALTGAVYGDRCFSTPAEAVDAYYSVAAPALTSGSTSFLTQWVKDSGVWWAKSWSLDSSGVATLRYNIPAPVPTFQACDPAQTFLDGVEVGWGIAAAVIMAACVMLMRRGTS